MASGRWQAPRREACAASGESWHVQWPESIKGLADKRQINYSMHVQVRIDSLLYAFNISLLIVMVVKITSIAAMSNSAKKTEHFYWLAVNKSRTLFFLPSCWLLVYLSTRLVPRIYNLR